MSEPAGRGPFWTEQRVLSASRRDAPLPGPRSRSLATREEDGLRRPGGERDKRDDEGGQQHLPPEGSPVRRTPTANRQRPRYLRLVADDGRLVPQPPDQPARVRREPVRAAAPRQAVAPRRAVARRPLRLTRRGRLVVTATAVLLVAAVSMTLAGVAQATGHSAGT